MALTDARRLEYNNLFGTCTIRPGKLNAVEKAVDKINANRGTYENLLVAIGMQHVPWFAVGGVHIMENNLSFSKHLHNGDPLTARTVQVPKGHPKRGNPPFTWEESAHDALALKSWQNETDPSLAALLYKLEAYNGFGYRRADIKINSPYLWSFSHHYTKGKFVADGKYDPNAVSAQVGVAVLLRNMVDRGIITLAPNGDLPAPTEPDWDSGARVHYSSKVVPFADAFQRYLNTRTGAGLVPDGKPGKKTSDAYHSLSGRYLPGDPRS